MHVYKVDLTFEIIVGNLEDCIQSDQLYLSTSKDLLRMLQCHVVLKYFESFCLAQMTSLCTVIKSITKCKT